MLLDLTSDPFDDVRQSAMQLLMLRLCNDLCLPISEQHASSLCGHSSPTSLLLSLGSCLERSEMLMLRTGRTEHADGVSRLYEILYEHRNFATTLPSLSAGNELSDRYPTAFDVVEDLVSKVEVAVATANENRAKAIEQCPLHGYIASIRCVRVQNLSFRQARIANLRRRILGETTLYSQVEHSDQNYLLTFRPIHKRVFDFLEAIWVLVRDVLCDDAPEGHFPDDLDDEVDLSSRDVLSFSWRALNEARYCSSI